MTESATFEYPPPPRSKRTRGLAGFLKGSGLSIFGIAVVLLVWEIAARWGNIANGTVVPFTTALETAWNERSYLLSEMLYTGKAALAGYLLSVVVGVTIAVGIVSFRPVSRAVWPMIVMSQVVPKIAVAPVFLVWFGFGITSKILIAFLLSFFPIVIDSVLGLRSTSIEQIYLARSMGAGKLKTFRRIRLQNALPSMFTGFKLAATFCVTGAIVGEFVGSDNGIGRVILASSARLNPDVTFAAILYVTGLGFIAFFSIRLIEGLMIPWHVSRRQKGARHGSRSST